MKINDNIAEDSRYLLIKRKIHHELSSIKVHYNIQTRNIVSSQSFMDTSWFQTI